MNLSTKLMLGAGFGTLAAIPIAIGAANTAASIIGDRPGREAMEVYKASLATHSRDYLKQIARNTNAIALNHTGADQIARRDQEEAFRRAMMTGVGRKSTTGNPYIFGRAYPDGSPYSAYGVTP